MENNVLETMLLSIELCFCLEIAFSNILWFHLELWVMGPMIFNGIKAEWYRIAITNEMIEDDLISVLI